MADETPKKGGRATITADDTVKFLISCIKFVTGSKIDWKAVAAECGIVSSAAAAKRYERLLKANGVGKTKPITEGNDNGGPEEADVTPKAKTPRAKKANGDTPKKTPASKKRKVASVEKDGEAGVNDNATATFASNEPLKNEQV